MESNGCLSCKFYHIIHFCLFRRSQSCPSSGNPPPSNGNRNGVVDLSDESSQIWFFLTSLYQGCGRYTPMQHALKHFEAAGDDFLAINIKTLAIWCYGCDNELEAFTPGLGDFVNSVQEIC